MIAHTGQPDVEDVQAGVLRQPDLVVLPMTGMEGPGAFDPRTGSGAVFTDIHPTPEGPRYATRKDFVYGEDVTIADWTISTENLPLYAGRLRLRLRGLSG
nr:hypothetical protein [Streptomyces uncialis]